MPAEEAPTADASGTDLLAPGAADALRARRPSRGKEELGEKSETIRLTSRPAQSSPRLWHALVLVAAISLVAGSTVVSAMCARAYLRADGDPLLLSIMVLLFGTVPLLWLDPHTSGLLTTNRESLAVAGMLHACQTMLTHASLQTATVTTVYSVKVIEPVVAAVLAGLLRGKLPSFAETGMLALLSITTATSLNGGRHPANHKAVLAVGIAAVMAALRSTSSKSSSQRDSDYLRQFAAISLRGTAAALLFIRPSHFSSFGSSWEDLGIRQLLLWSAMASLVSKLASSVVMSHLGNWGLTQSDVLRRAAASSWDMVQHASDHPVGQRVAVTAANLIVLAWTRRRTPAAPIRQASDDTHQRQLIRSRLMVLLGALAMLVTGVVIALGDGAPVVPRPFGKPRPIKSSAELAAGVTAQLQALRGELEADLVSSRLSIASVHRVDAENIGDLYSSPFVWFNQLNNTGNTPTAVYDLTTLIHHLPELKQHHVIIVGGGGLLGVEGHWDRVILRMLNAAEAQHQKVIAWGIGFNHRSEIGSKRGDFYPHFEGQEQFSMLGVRDRLPGHRWVPCASSLAPAFDKPYEIKRKVALYRTWNYDKPVPDFGLGPDAMRLNNDPDFEKTIEFLGSSEIVITTSYHGLYWSTLLGRKVILLDINSRKFDYFPFPPARYTGNLTDDVHRAKNYPDALRLVRTASLGFWRDVQHVMRQTADELDHYEG